MKNQAQIASLKSQIATNEMYAKAGLKTYEKTGRDSAYNSAQQHLAAADSKRARLAELEKADE